MSEQLRLMCILAHPDDESLGTGGILAKYATEGVQTYLVTATRGEQGWFGNPDEYPGPEHLGRIREAELRAASAALGLQDLALLGYRDGDLDQADPDEAVAEIVSHVRRARPHVVVTFDQNGLYGHPDHVAICQFATAAVVAAADPGYVDASLLPAHRVSKLYYVVWRREVREAYEAAFGELVMQIGGHERRAVTWPDWAITTWVDTRAHWEQVWEAITCHRSQLPGYRKLRDLPEEHHQKPLG